MRQLAQAMAQTIAHRGPDGTGVWVDERNGLALAHRRLSIVELSAAGAQPMASASGRFAMAYNGEVYNHDHLRADLPGFDWRGHSDTEVLLAGFERWGVEPTLKRAVGMFAFALWDRHEQALWLGRDRIGEKPLYYGWSGGTLLFGSELQALRAHPSFDAQIDRNALALLLRHNYIPAPYSIFNGIKKLQPGTTLRLSALQDGQAEPRPYWTMREAVESGMKNPFEGTDREAIDRLEQVLGQAVSLQRMADVPLGAFLSGGVDSSLIVSLMQAQSSVPVSTFTIGFDVPEFNEAEHAAAVARHLGTRHTELIVSAKDALNVVERLPAMYSEPFADSSQIPTFLVAQMARRDVTVTLSGDAGDELFGGYTRYDLASRLWAKLEWLPRPLRRATAGLLRGIPVQSWDRVLGPAARAWSSTKPAVRLGDRAHKLAEMLDVGDAEAFYRLLVSHDGAPSRLVPGAVEPATALTDRGHWPSARSLHERMMYLDSVSYLPDDILVKVDRASMAVSLESRVPMLDHRVVEFAWSLPERFKRRDGRGKWVLRELLYRRVPRHLIDRPKTGFGVPLGHWLRGPLRDWGESLLDEATIREQGWFDPAAVRRCWLQHQSGAREWSSQLWNILMFQAWLRQQ